MMNYHKVTYKDCLSVATPIEAARLGYRFDMCLLKSLAAKWCDNNGHKLGGYLGWSKSDGYSWDSTKD